MPGQHIGERIRTLRRQRNLTLQQVAEKTGLTAGFLSQMERNLTGVTLSSLVSISQALNVPLHGIITQPTQVTPDTHQGKRQDYSIEKTSLHYERLTTLACLAVLSCITTGAILRAGTPPKTLVVAQSISDAVSFDPAEGYELTTVQSFNSIYQ